LKKSRAASAQIIEVDDRGMDTVGGDRKHLERQPSQHLEIADPMRPATLSYYGKPAGVRLCGMFRGGGF